MPRAVVTGLILLAAISFRIAFSQQAKPAFVREFNWPVPPGSTFPESEWERVKSPEAESYSTAKLDVLPRLAEDPKHDWDAGRGEGPGAF